MLGGVSCLFVGVSNTAAAGGEVAVSAALASRSVRVGEAVAFEVTIETVGAVGEISAPRFPRSEGLEIIGRGSRTGMSWGRSATRSRSFSYALVPSQAGKISLDVHVRVGGKDYGLSPVPVLEVVGISTLPNANSPTEGSAHARPTDPSDPVVVWPTVDRAEVYVGEQVNYEFEIWERVRSEITMHSMPTFKDYWVEELPTKSERRDQISGVGYRVHPGLRRVLFPQRAGRLPIGGGTVAVQRRSGLGSLFRRRGGGEAVEIGGPPLTVTVKALPAAGQPPNFMANNVGVFSIEATADRTELAQGDALTLTVRVSGEGNIRLLKPDPWPNLEGMRSYDPTPSEPEITFEGERIHGSKRYEFLIVAEDVGTWTIPAYTLSFFDPGRGKYRRESTKPLKIQVVPGKGAAAGRPEARHEEADPDRRAEDDELGDGPEDPLTQILGLERLPRSSGHRGETGPLSWRTSVAAVSGILGLGWAGGRLYGRLGPDERQRARSVREAQRREQLAQAHAAVATGDGFYTALSGLLHGAAVARAGAAGAGLTRERLLTVLKDQGLADQEIESLRGMLDACDGARFGAGVGDPESRKAMLTQAETMISQRTWRVR